MAVKMAAAYLYDMVELDVRESHDHHPVVFHDRNMMRACGIDGEISDFTLDALTQIRFLKSDEAVTSLDAMLGLCRSLNLGVMFDIKSAVGSDLFINRILDLIEKYDLERACILLGDSLVQENGALVIPAINTFRYSKEHHRSEAYKDVERLLEAGVDGFQIDCIYQDYFGRPKD